jgi:hypothetical protein
MLSSVMIDNSAPAVQNPVAIRCGRNARSDDREAEEYQRCARVREIEAVAARATFTIAAVA